MHLDRRSFLRAAAGVAVAGLAPVRLADVAAAAPGGAGAGLTMASFTPLVNTWFRFAVGGRSVVMPLTAVVDERRPGTTGEAFSLLFAGTKPAFASGTYVVDHATLKRFSLYLGPVGNRAGGQDYQAVFNRTAG